MLAMTLLICGAVLCVAIAALFIFQVLNFRSSFQRDTSTLAVIIANNSTAAMEFKNDEDATEVLSALKAKPTVVSASLVLPNGSLFAKFGTAEDARARSNFPAAGEYRFTGWQLLVSQPVIVKKNFAGTLYLRSDYEKTFLQLLGFYGMVVASLIIVSIGLAAFLSGRLGRRITDPILDLARTAKIIGELKDYSVRATGSGEADEVGRLADSFNEMLGRIQSQDAALNLSQQKMEALVNSIDGIVWERAMDTFRFTFVSRQSEDILGYAPKAWLENTDFWEGKLELQDATKAIQNVRERAARGESYTCEYRIRASDGRVVWIHESGTVLVENGKPIALRGIFQDITRQKQAAEELDRLNRQLIDTSRSAGMADVATGVLHNVGNVLNSVSVSTTLVGERLRRSKITRLCRATAMMREQNGHLAEYLTTDPKGKLIPEFLTNVAGELATEQIELIAKMTTVGEHVEHIKEIVAMQQSYAKVSGVFENLLPTTLVEDALRINATAFDRHHIELIREFAPDIPPVCVDRHKVLQILINLLRNAKHAMDEKDDCAKRLVVQVGMASPASIKITIADNGIGIPAEHMTKIFNHGFTTKKEGHGFGLHSGANAAKEMGGSLTAKSASPGQGAEFTLVLPIAQHGQKADRTTPANT